MPAIDQGYQYDIVVKKEATLGVAPGASGARVLRRTSAMLNLKRARVASNEKRESFQVADSRHGSESVEGTIAQELYNGGATELFEVLLMRDFAAVTAIAAGVGTEFSCASGVLSRASGSMATAGLRNGMVVRFTGLGTNLANRNWLVSGMAQDGLSCTITPVDGGAAAADFTSDSSGSLVIPGKRTFIPNSGHLLQSLAIERRNRVRDTSELSLGCKVTTLGLKMGVNAMVTLDWGIIGLSQTDSSGGSSPYYTSPATPGFGRAFSSAKGLLMLNGELVAVATGVSLDFANGAATFPVVFSQTSPDVPLGRALTVTGQVTAARVDATLRSLFRNESEFRMTMVLEAPAVAGTAPEFIAFDLPRCKVNSSDEDDPDGSVIQTLAIEALEIASGVGVDGTTIAVQDSSL
jgi:hypothetical protein